MSTPTDSEDFGPANNVFFAMDGVCAIQSLVGVLCHGKAQRRKPCCLHIQGILSVQC